MGQRSGLDDLNDDHADGRSLHPRVGRRRGALTRAIQRLSLYAAVVIAVAAIAAPIDARAVTRLPARQKAMVKVKAVAPVKVQPPPYGQRDDVRAFIDDLVAHEHLDRDDLQRTLADAHYSETAARLMSPTTSSGVRRDWTAYRARFVEPVRLGAGYQFWDDNADVLARAERDFGVPAEIIVGILGCETVYGRNTGSFRVVDTLTTLSFDYPNNGRDRSPFFREQLTDALLMSRDGTVDLATLRGSYAGAIGMPQFMPGSIRHYGIDYDGDGRIDLVGSPADVIGSVANFLAQHGWVRDLPPYVALTHPSVIDDAQGARIDALVAAGSEPGLALAALTDVGFVANLPAALPPSTPFALIDLPSGSDARGLPRTSYLAGTQNFHVITRYNRSYFYALSVIELGTTIKALRDARLPP